MQRYNILLADDDPFILEGIGKDLESEGYQVTRAENGEIAVALLESIDFDLVITDLVMDSTDGIRVLKKTKALNPDIQVIILTGYGDIKSAIEALRNQADDFLLKPCESQEMLFRVKNCLEKQELTRRIKLYQKILPMCCVCKKIRDDSGKKPGTGDWISIEKFIHEQANLDITSSYCPECARKTMAEFTHRAL
ncbi:MAG: response regulator [Desulfobacterales bacterium]|nr:response regulator [Desulfobacterales bacterium]